jgi:hypothetical protein
LPSGLFRLKHVNSNYFVQKKKKQERRKKKEMAGKKEVRKILTKKDGVCVGHGK